MKNPTENRFIPMTSVSSGKGREVKDDIFYYTNQIVNLITIGNPREGEWVLVDAGISCRETERRMERLNLSMKKVRALFISHEHTDHVRGVRVLSKKYQLPVYSTPGTLRAHRARLHPDADPLLGGRGHRRPEDHGISQKS